MVSYCQLMMPSGLMLTLASGAQSILVWKAVEAARPVSLPTKGTTMTL